MKKKTKFMKKMSNSKIKALVRKMRYLFSETILFERLTKEDIIQASWQIKPPLIFEEIIYKELKSQEEIVQEVEMLSNLEMNMLIKQCRISATSIAMNSFNSGKLNDQVLGVVNLLYSKMDKIFASQNMFIKFKDIKLKSLNGKILCVCKFKYKNTEFIIEDIPFSIITDELERELKNKLHNIRREIEQINKNIEIREKHQKELERIEKVVLRKFSELTEREKDRVNAEYEARKGGIRQPAGYWHNGVFTLHRDYDCCKKLKSYSSQKFPYVELNHGNSKQHIIQVFEETKYPRSNCMFCGKETKTSIIKNMGRYHRKCINTLIDLNNKLTLECKLLDIPYNSNFGLYNMINGLLPFDYFKMIGMGSSIPMSVLEIGDFIIDKLKGKSFGSKRIQFPDNKVEYFLILMEDKDFAPIVVKYCNDRDIEL